MFIMKYLIAGNMQGPEQNPDGMNSINNQSIFFIVDNFISRGSSQ